MNEVYCLNDDAWEEWKEFRSQELRKKIGPIAQRKQIAFLCNHPPPVQQQIIDQSIMNSWQGLFPLKNQVGKPGVRHPNTSTRHRALADDLNDTSWAS